MDGELAQLVEQPLFTARRIGVMQQGELNLKVKIASRLQSAQNFYVGCHAAK
jgi:hypothetical protein